MNLFDHTCTLEQPVSERLEIAIRQIEFARRYTLSLLEDLTAEDWFFVPQTEQMATHIAWQCGHIAMAQYGLTLFRQRGRETVDSSLMSGKFRKRFMRGTEPTSNPEDYPTPDEIREVMDKVHKQMLIEAPHLDGQNLDEPLEEGPHAGFATKLGSFLFCAQHEMVHAGQIGLLRRLMGKGPLR